MESRHALGRLTDLELLERREEMAMDDHRRLAGLCGVTLAATHDAQAVFVGGEAPDGLVPALLNAVDASPFASTPDVEPPALAACRAILEPGCAPLDLNAGPVYLIEPHVRVEARTRIVRSDTPATERPRLVNPGTWEHAEWDDLLGGALGPWAMAVVAGNVASIAHTPGPLSARTAEVGLWTQPDHRGRGLAAEVTAAWADILRPSGRYLFYSTDQANMWSQRVAARLGLRLLGWTWSLHRAGRGPRDTRHPLSRRGT